VYIPNPLKIEIVYDLPAHLRGVESIEEMRKRDLEALDQELREKGSSLDEKIKTKSIWRMGFPGMVLDITNLSYINGNATLTAVPIHPHRADLAFHNSIHPVRRGSNYDTTLDRNVTPLTALGPMVDRDNHFIMGLRKGNVGTGLGIIPGGHVDYTIPPMTNPVGGLEQEFGEEVGYPFGDGGERIVYRAVMDNFDINGLNVVYGLKSDRTFEEIQEAWRTAKDRGIHKSLHKLTPSEARELADKGQITKGNQIYSSTPLFRRALGYVVENVSA